MHVTDLAAAFSRIQSSWNPHIVGELSRQLVKVAKLRGEFIHRHEAEDELFPVHRDTLMIRLRDRTRTPGPVQFCIIPRGVDELTRDALKTLEA